MLGSRQKPTGLKCTRLSLVSSRPSVISRPYSPLRRTILTHSPSRSVKIGYSQRLDIVSKLKNEQQAALENDASEKSSTLSTITARILISIPIAAALLGFPRSAKAAPPLSVPPPFATVINAHTGMPNQWVTSTGSWSQKDYNAIYDFYTKPQVPALAQRTEQKQKKASVAAPPKKEVKKVVEAVKSVEKKVEEKKVEVKKQPAVVEAVKKVGQIPKKTAAPSKAAAPAKTEGKTTATTSGLVTTLDGLKTSFTSKVDSLKFSAVAVQQKMTAAAKVESPVPTTGKKQQQEKKKKETKPAPPSVSKKVEAKNTTTTNKAAAPQQKRESVDLIAKAEAFRQRLGQAAAFKQAAVNALPKVSSSSSTTAAMKNNNGKSGKTDNNTKKQAPFAKVVKKEIKNVSKTEQKQSNPPQIWAGASKQALVLRDTIISALQWQPKSALSGLSVVATSSKASAKSSSSASAWGWNPTIIAGGSGSTTTTSAPAWGWNPTTVVEIQGNCAATTSSSAPAWGWNPTTLVDIKSTDAGPIWWWNPQTVSTPPRNALVAAALIGTAYLLGLAWHRTHSLRGEATEAIDTEIIGAKSLPGSGSDGTSSSSDENVWVAGRRPGAAEFESVAGARVWEPAPSPPVKTREELIAESQRRIEAAKAAVEKQKAENEVMKEAVEKKAAKLASSVEEQQASSSAAAASDRSAPVKTPQDTRDIGSSSSSSGFFTKKGEIKSTPPKPTATTKTEHDPIGAFTDALDSRDHATPLLAILGLASAAVSGAADILTGKSSTSSSTSRSSNNKDWSATDVLLAPAAPLIANLPPGAAPSFSFKPSNNYDVVLDVLKGVLDSPTGRQGAEKYSPIRALLEATPSPRPTEREARYDFVRTIIRGLAESQDQPAPSTLYDMIQDLVRTAAQAEDPESKAAADRFCMLQNLIHAAKLVEDWGPQPSKYDPFEGVVGTVSEMDWELSDWAGPSKFCPVTALMESSPAPRGQSSKYDPFSSALNTLTSPSRNTADSPYRNKKYDFVAAVFDAIVGSQAPPPRKSQPVATWDPVAVALDAAAGWEPPTPSTTYKYDPMPELLLAGKAMAVPHRSDGGATWDPLNWILSGWAGEWDDTSDDNSEGSNSEGTSSTRMKKKESSALYNPAAGLRNAQPPTVRSKYDLMQAILQSEAPEGPLSNEEDVLNSRIESGWRAKIMNRLKNNGKNGSGESECVPVGSGSMSE